MVGWYEWEFAQNEERTFRSGREKEQERLVRVDDTLLLYGSNKSSLCRVDDDYAILAPNSSRK